MLTLTNEGAAYRTKCLTLDAAARFAKCISANERFGEVSIEESKRAKGEKRFFVQFVPANEERVADMLTRQQDARALRAAEQQFTFLMDKDAGRPFFWCHSHTSGEVYEVDAQGRSCECGDFRYRCQGTGLKCKHILALESHIAQTTKALLDTPEPEPCEDATYSTGPAGARCKHAIMLGHKLIETGAGLTGVPLYPMSPADLAQPVRFDREAIATY